jgi:hypothetical protein
MKPSNTDLWSAWNTNPDIRELAEAYLTKPSVWDREDEALCALIHADPDRALSILFAIMQLTEDQKVLDAFAAGPLEDFLGVHGEAYLETIHSLALEHRRLREALDGVWQGSMSKNVWRKIEVLKQSSFSS